jgi:two-component system, chemotaxis family, chemotaxis protein CheY
MAIKILLVDDSLLARMAVKKYLPDDLECELYEAADGAQGIKQYKKINPDIVFMDLTMPVMSGFAVLGEIKKTNPDAKVVVLSADVQKRTIEKVMELGAFRILRKPPQKDDIRKAVADALFLGESGGKV